MFPSHFKKATASCHVKRGYGLQQSTHSNATCKKENYLTKTISKTTRPYGSTAEKLICHFSVSNLFFSLRFFPPDCESLFLSSPDV